MQIRHNIHKLKSQISTENEHTSRMLEVGGERNGRYFDGHFGVEHTVRPAQSLQKTTTRRHQQFITETDEAANDIVRIKHHVTNDATCY